MTDLTYTQDNMFTRFVAASKEGEAVWREMAKEDGVAAVLNNQAQSVINQIRNSGYSVKKSKPVTKKEMQIIFDELAELGV